jgi:hypothetical protein
MRHSTADLAGISAIGNLGRIRGSAPAEDGSTEEIRKITNANPVCVPNHKRSRLILEMDE